MRQSKRTLILEAGSRVVQRDGVTALTYESVAQEAGVTKGGLLYHFPSRKALLLALHEHVAGQWEAAMEADAGGPAAEVDADSRFRAYARLHETPARAELLLMLEASEHEAADAIWQVVHNRWAPPVPQARRDESGAEAQSGQGQSGEEQPGEEQSGEAPGAGSAAGHDAGSEYDAEAVRAFLARLAADGLWLYEALDSEGLDPALHDRLLREMTRMA
ncbi:TetR/AcrR family transcriptional regulator [Nesterenkonia lacusekhoensis]|uniref:AcrR family transcriptional regulator n=1 Tax=Nesterenkonia lacusekhoensis TaxID=150832 RepID=A0ABS4T4Q1_9MICC|nr:TetR family transcriptional regulator [Nesterenkonia lacusekhoensis]MBP2319429.1 AcrR family transcriptional regulator [Nesterenkonia lacusekhoensis]